MSQTTEEPPPPALAEGIGAVVRPLAAHFAALDTFLAEQVEAFEPEVRPLVRFTFQHSGKKIRPILVFAAGWTGEGEPAAGLVKGAAIVELVHLATLVHDDILDGATLRHRMATAAEAYGAHAAVLLGDALFAHALKLAADFPETTVCRVVARATRQVCSGEIVQTLKEPSARADYAHYFRVIDLKTAELFAVSAELGAYLSGAPPAFREAAAAFARDLGIAYQIYDDLTDFAGREEKAGKTLGTDLAGGKCTLPLLRLFDRLSEDQARDLRAAVLAGEADAAELDRLMRAHGVYESVRDTFVELLDRAEDRLAPFAERPAVPRLRALAAFIRAAIGRYF